MIKRATVLVFLPALLFGAILAEGQESIEVSYQGKPWAVKIDAPGFAVKKNETTGDLRQSMMANNAGTGMVLSVMLERVPKADAKNCPDYLHKRIAGLAGLGVSDVRYSTAGTMSVAEYMIAGTPQMPLQQKNLVACTAKDDIYIDIHFSKAQFQPGQEALFTSLLDKVTIGTPGTSASDGFIPATPAFTPAAKQESSRTYFAIGSRYYMQQQYADAIPQYEKALELEKQQPTLDQNLWRVLVDNLGMAYGMTGDLADAERIFQFGLSKDPTYPMFSYNMACVYGEKRDLDNAVVWLKRAWANRANSIPSEGLPDPRRDDSFHNFLGKPKFEEAVGGWR